MNENEIYDELNAAIERIEAMDLPAEEKTALFKGALDDFRQGLADYRAARDMLAEGGYEIGGEG